MFNTMVITKIIGAFCGTLLIFLVGKWVADELYQPGSRHLDPAFVIAVEGADDDAEEVVELTFAQALAVADPGAGQSLYAQCRACHSLDEGRNGVGPYLYNVMGREIGGVAGFNYSGALPAGTWEPENLEAFIHNPRGFAPGTSMAYSGMANVENRANLVAFLISQSPDYDFVPPVVEEVVEEGPAEEAAVEDEAVTEEAPTEEAAADVPATEEPAVEEAATEEAVTEEAATEEAVTEEAAAGESEIAIAFAAADPEAGRALWRNCQACHVANAESNRVGPHLVGMIGREIGAVEGFRYSGRLPEGTWTLENLDAFIENPREFAPGTSMVFPGMRSLEDRANLIAYIDSVSP